MDIRHQAERRRTFAIISHPDAGKTTLTEKLLLYARAIHLAGSVKSRKASRHAVSDWMQMEKERGISVTTSVLQFEHRGKALNLLDTPGHADFSEDTFRTLAAVDTAVMLMDHAKGVEPRTQKLFEVCRLRKLPVVTFMNKLDRHGLDPLELLDQVSRTLDLKMAPVNWPIGKGDEFRGVVDVASREVSLFDAHGHGDQIVVAHRMPLTAAEAALGSSLFDSVWEDLELLEGAGEKYSHDAFLAGELSPVFWGSAMDNFGVEALLDYIVDHAAPPAPRSTQEGQVIAPTDDRFSGFIFKIQANMNPRHRDRIAFMRVVSGHFERGMDVVIGRTGETLRMAKPHSFLAQERSLVEEAWPGDIVGVYDSGKLRVGESLAAGTPTKFAGIPHFAPEYFGKMTLADPMRRKSLDSGLEQLAQEGVIQVLLRPGDTLANAILGAVGLLQFDVLAERLANEYNVRARFETLPYNHARWINGPQSAIDWLKNRSDCVFVTDSHGNPVVLAATEWTFKFALDKNKGLELHTVEPL
ncbi:MAG: peptide chain release factor 3 [Deltaproteobacteria bacterium]|nr:peptide chain release factor 3 [Deltaproteobacteria bacterium]